MAEKHAGLFRNGNFVMPENRQTESEKRFEARVQWYVRYYKPYMSYPKSHSRAIAEAQSRIKKQKEAKYGNGNENHGNHHHAGFGAGTGLLAPYGSGNSTAGEPGEDPGVKEEIATGTEPLLAWKGLLVNNVGCLVSKQGGQIWPIFKRIEAKCLTRSDYGYYTVSELPRHVAPFSSCNCGIHASLDISTALEYTRTENGGTGAIAEISMWGHVIVNEKGYRAQYAYPHKIMIISENERLRARTAKLYGVPVTLNNNDDILDMVVANMLTEQ